MTGNVRDACRSARNAYHKHLLRRIYKQATSYDAALSSALRWFGHDLCSVLCLARPAQRARPQGLPHVHLDSSHPIGVWGRGQLGSCWRGQFACQKQHIAYE